MAEQVIWSAKAMDYSIGTQNIFNQAEFSIAEGEKVALVGRNGCGKSTLLSVIKGELLLHDAEICKMRNLRIASLDQEFTLPGNLTVHDSVKSGQDFIYSLLEEYENSTTTQARHEELEHYLNLHNAWHPEVLLDEVSLIFCRLLKTDDICLLILYHLRTGCISVNPGICSVL